MRELNLVEIQAVSGSATAPNTAVQDFFRGLMFPFLAIAALADLAGYGGNTTTESFFGGLKFLLGLR